jgi:hypothetical protein
MKKPLRFIAAAVVLATLIFWSATGFNRGWTKTSLPVKTVDDVTGIEAVTYQKKFIPGVDFLAAAMGVGILFFGTSFLFRTKQSPRTSNEQTTNR